MKDCEHLCSEVDSIYGRISICVVCGSHWTWDLASKLYIIQKSTPEEKSKFFTYVFKF